MSPSVAAWRQDVKQESALRLLKVVASNLKYAGAGGRILGGRDVDDAGIDEARLELSEALEFRDASNHRLLSVNDALAFKTAPAAHLDTRQ